MNDAAPLTEHDIKEVNEYLRLVAARLDAAVVELGSSHPGLVLDDYAVRLRVPGGHGWWVKASIGMGSQSISIHSHTGPDIMQSARTLLTKIREEIVP